MRSDFLTHFACVHGSDGRDSCFGCQYGESVGPEPERKVRHVRLSARFVEQARELSGDHRWPLRAL